MSAELHQEEEIQHRSFEPRLLWRLLLYLKPYSARVILALGLIILAAGVSQLGPRLTQVAVDDHIMAGDLDGLKWILLLFFASIGAQYLFQYGQTPVSYTHLRAHETDSYLVCRLLLEKKK